MILIHSLFECHISTKAIKCCSKYLQVRMDLEAYQPEKKETIETKNRDIGSLESGWYASRSMRTLRGR